MRPYSGNMGRGKLGCCSLAPCFYGPENEATHSGWDPPTLINRVKIILHGHAQRPISWMSLDITKPTTESSHYTYYSGVT